MIMRPRPFHYAYVDGFAGTGYHELDAKKIDGISLFAEDDEPDYLYEFGGKAAVDDEVIRRGRLILREAAAAALAQAGYEGDPRLRGAARRIVERINTFLRSPFGAKPWIRIGNQHVLAPEMRTPEKAWAAV